MQITVKVNGADRSADVEPRMLLAHLIREEFGLTGTHVGCDTTSCGACTVLLDGRPIKSCTMFGVQADGREVTTVEGLLQDGQLHPIQAAFKEEHGLQCGFCTPGMMLTGTALLAENPSPSEDEVRWAISGNICRCTGYMNIVKAIQAAGRDMAAGAGRATRPTPPWRAEGDDMAAETEEIRGHRTQRPARRGRPVHPRRRQLHRRHPPARDAVHGDPAEPVRAREAGRDRRLGGAGARGRDRGRHRRADGTAQPRVDADAFGGHGGGARHRQGAVPGPGGRGGDRDRPLRREGRPRADRCRLRATRGRRVAGPGEGGRRAADPRREGGPDRQPHLPLGVRRQGVHGHGVRAGRQGRVPRHVLPALAPVAAGDLWMRGGREPGDRVRQRST